MTDGPGASELTEGEGTMAEKKTSPWIYIGCGCLLVMAIGIVAGIGGCYFLVDKVSGYAEGLKDPAVREERALDVLGADALPEGYNALFGINVFGFFEVAVIGTGGVAPDGEPSGLGREGLVYLKMPFANESQKQEMKDFFEGKTNSLETLRQSNINVNASEMITRGTLQSRNMSLQYVTSRGNVSVEGMDQSGLISAVIIDCEQDSKQCLGVWYGPEPDAKTAEGEIDLAGSVGDEARIQAFFDGFDLCQ